MDTNSIDKAYDEMLNIADDINTKNEITEEDAEKLQNIKKIVLEDHITLEDKIEVKDQAPTKVVGSYNPATGDVAVSDSSSEDIVKKISDKQFEMFTSNSNNEITFDKSLLEKYFNSSEINNIEDISILADVIKNKMNGKKIRFDDLPKMMKDTIIGIATKQTASAEHKLDKGNLNAISNMVMDSFIEDYKKSHMTSIDLDSMLAGFDTDVEKMQNDMSKEIANMYLDTDQARKSELDAAIERCKSEGKTEGIEKLEKMRSAIDNAYNLNDFSEFCKKVRIKKFDLEKPKRIYSSFNSKYENHINNINNIADCPMILNRHIKDDPTSNLKLCLAFCKYCMNMSPDNIEEHTFMYYFIRNIITIDRINPKGLLYDSINEKEKFFYDGFLSNIKKCIFNLNNR